MPVADTPTLEAIIAELLGENDLLRANHDNLQRQFDRYKERVDRLETGTIEELSKLGYIVLRENETITDVVNEESFIRWIRWAMTDGWEQLTAPTFKMAPWSDTPNPDAETLKERLGPIRKELGLD